MASKQSDRKCMIFQMEKKKVNILQQNHHQVFAKDSFLNETVSNWGLPFEKDNRYKNIVILYILYNEI